MKGEPSMSRVTRKVTIAFVIMVIAAIFVLGGYYVLSNQNVSQTEETYELPTSEVGKLKAKDLQTKYPGTPSEVVKLYLRLNKCMYNNSMNEKDFQKLLKQLRYLYDDELLGIADNSWDKMLSNMKEDCETFQSQNKMISTYSVDKNSDVKYGKVKRSDCAELLINILETDKKNHTRTYEKFMCRQNSQGRWKILGWTQVSGNSVNKSK